MLPHLHTDAGGRGLIMRIIVEMVTILFFGFAIGMLVAKPPESSAPLKPPPPVCTCYCPAPMLAEGSP